MFLTPQMLASIRAATLRAMTDTCLIERLADGVGRMGQVAQMWETVGSNVSCRLITSKGASLSQTDVFANRVTMEDTYTISLPVGTVLATDYRITVNGSVYRVASVLDGRTDSADVQAVLIRMRQDAS